MECWHCDRPAHGVCRFCGRGVCKEHAQTMPYVLQIYPAEGQLKALVVGDTLHCGVCKPKKEPIVLEKI
jgi:hypothetical protein